ncbi:339_t:CDS:2 [Acaulospora morrowiae]|uniref:339_t:CDS:1 n=1 Tax=Acaulospora morrowiae TaxID=94023 RepID=A0A9N8WCP7_9GLOM|nr:339_t:CDS:2 [Acaulospora morrowiae]
MGQNPSNESKRDSSVDNKTSTELNKKDFSEIDLISLKTSFSELSFVDEDGNIVVDEKLFLRYLKIPEEIGAGSLIYRSFCYLSKYPSVGYSHDALSYDGFIQAIAIYCGKIEDMTQENRIKLLFDSFSTCANDDDKKVPFGDFVGRRPEHDPNVTRVDCRSMLNLLTAIAWIMTTEMTPVGKEYKEIQVKHATLISSRNINQIREEITPVVEQMARYDTDVRNLSSSITWTTFQKFFQRNTPNIFCALSSYMEGQFLIGQIMSQKRQESMFFGPPVQYWPLLDYESDILSPIKMAILSWMLPNEIIKLREWKRLYSGYMNGFNMNSFSSSVHKYQGPILMFIYAETLMDNKSSLQIPLSDSYSPQSSLAGIYGSLGRSFTSNSYGRSYSSHSKSSSCELPEELLLGAYVADPWISPNSPKSTFGSDECALFELSPSFELFPASKKGRNFVYYNTSVGIGFGGPGMGSNKNESSDTNSFVLQLDSTLQYGRYRFDPLRERKPAYDPPETRTFFDIPFKVAEIEVFGVGGEKIFKRGVELQQKGIKFTNNSFGRHSIGRYSVSSVDDSFKMSGILDYASIKEAGK